jgi:septal ring factor EnvC (AmiA/AmiB activator)
MISPLLLAASVPVQPHGETLDTALERARAEQQSAEIETKRLELVAQKARNDAERLQAQQAAAAQSIEAAEARITAADANLRLVSATAEQRRAELQRQQRPIAALLSGLVMMARRPPLLAIADEGSTDELVQVRVLLDSTLPVIRRRTAALSAQFSDARRLEASAVAARDEFVQSRQTLVVRRQEFAALEAKAVAASTTARGQALASGDVALAAGENVSSLQSGESGSRAAYQIASELAADSPAPLRPDPPEGGGRPTPFAYRLPAEAPVTQGLGAVDRTGVRSRGLVLATGSGAALVVPASGVIRFSGPFRSHNGVVIIDHGGGWLSLIVNVATRMKPGDRVTIGQPLGRALGQIEIQLSQNGRRVSPALIAGSSQTLSNNGKSG